MTGSFWSDFSSTSAPVVTAEEAVVVPGEETVVPAMVWFVSKSGHAIDAASRVMRLSKIPVKEFCNMVFIFLNRVVMDSGVFNLRLYSSDGGGDDGGDGGAWTG